MALKDKCMLLVTHDRYHNRNYPISRLNDYGIREFNVYSRIIMARCANEMYKTLDKLKNPSLEDYSPHNTINS